MARAELVVRSPPRAALRLRALPRGDSGLESDGARSARARRVRSKKCCAMSAHAPEGKGDARGALARGSWPPGSKSTLAASRARGRRAHTPTPREPHLGAGNLPHLPLRRLTSGRGRTWERASGRAEASTRLTVPSAGKPCPRNSEIPAACPARRSWGLLRARGNRGWQSPRRAQRVAGSALTHCGRLYCGRCIRAEDPPHLPLERPERCRRFAMAGTTAELAVEHWPFGTLLLDHGEQRWDGLIAVEPRIAAACRAGAGGASHAQGAAPPARKRFLTARPPAACRTDGGELHGGVLCFRARTLAHACRASKACEIRSSVPATCVVAGPNRLRATSRDRAARPTRARRGRTAPPRANGSPVPARGD